METNIFALNQKYIAFCEQMEESGGEITEQLEELYADIEDSHEEISHSTVVLMNFISQNIENRVAEVERIQGKIEKDKNVLMMLEGRLKYIAKTFGKSKVTPTGKTNYKYENKSNDFHVNLGQSEKLIITDEELAKKAFPDFVKEEVKLTDLTTDEVARLKLFATKRNIAFNNKQNLDKTGVKKEVIDKLSEEENLSIKKGVQLQIIHNVKIK